jgi:hypothetical protein
MLVGAVREDIAGLVTGLITKSMAKSAPGSGIDTVITPDSESVVPVYVK